MKRKIFKILAIPVYLMCILLLWKQRYTFYAHLPFRNTPLGDLPLDTIFIALALVVAVIIARSLKAPLFWVKRADMAFERAGLMNHMGEYPKLIAVSQDPKKRHGKILKFNNKGISVPEFNAQAHRLEANLNGKIYRVEYGRNTSKTLVWLLPKRYVTPTIISPNDANFGNIQIKNLINLCCIGQTGAGKTVAMKVIIKKILQGETQGIDFWFIDVKQQDYAAYKNLPHYYSYDSALQGLEAFYAMFRKQKESGRTGNRHYLVVDEWAALLVSLRDRKDCERAKSILAEILMTGRSYHYIPLIGLQKAMSEYFGNARDNFSCCLAMGNLSPEAKRMMFPDDAESMTENNPTGFGYLRIDGCPLERVEVRPGDLARLDRDILSLIKSRSASEALGGEAEREPPGVSEPEAEGEGLT